MHQQTRLSRCRTAESGAIWKVFAQIPQGSNYRHAPKSRPARDSACQPECRAHTLIGAQTQRKVAWAPPHVPATVREGLGAYQVQSAALPGRRAARRWPASARTAQDRGEG